MISPVMPTYARAPIDVARGEGAYLIDAAGRRYLDFAAGIAVNILGHGHPHLVAALQEQAATLWHHSNLYRSPGQQRLAERLIAVSFADTVFFTNSGAEALECAIKTCRRFHWANGQPERTEIISFENAFHGRTLGTISATNQEKMRQGFEPLLPGFTVLPFNDLAAVEAAIGPHIGGILLETVQGEGGVTVAEPAFLRGLRALCDAHGILLLLDEVQCGVARTGTLFAYEAYGIVPDIMALAKGLGGGFPLGACLASERAALGMGVGTHGSTYGGNPLAMAVGNAVLDVVLAPDFLADVQAKGAALRTALTAFVADYPALFDHVRGVGLMLGLKCRIPARDFVNHARSEGLLLVAASQEVIRFLPPLNITDADIAEAMARLRAAVATFPQGVPVCQKTV